jgi:integrase
MQVPSIEEVGALLEAADDWFNAYIAMCAFAGLSLGEASGVQVGDVRFLERSVYVHRQVQRGVGSVAIVPPKHGSERGAPAPDDLLNLLAHHVEQIGVHGSQGWFFVGEGGMPPHANTIAYWWRKTQRDAGVSGTTCTTSDTSTHRASSPLAATS